MTYWRTTLGGCILSAALFVCSAGGAIAAADPDSDVATAADNQAAAESHISAGETPVSAGHDAISHTEPVGATTTETDSSASSGASGPAEPAGSAGPMTVAATTTVTGDDSLGGPTADTTKDDVAGSATVNLNADDGQSGQNAPAMQSTNNAPAPAALATHPQQTAPATPPVKDMAQVVAPVTKAVANAVRATGPFVAAIAALPSSPTPVTDFVTALQHLLTAVGAVGASLAQVPNDLVSLLGFPARAPSGMAGPVPGGVGISLGGDLPGTAAYAQVLPYLVAQLPPGVLSGAPPGLTVQRPTIGSSISTGSTDGLSVAAAAPSAPDGGAATGALSSLKHTVGAVFVAASLVALAAIALPGGLGLLTIGAAGIGAGFRQAKAAATLRPLGIARFAGSGPLGVVRSGSMIAVTPRRSRASRRQLSREANPLQPVA